MIHQTYTHPGANAALLQISRTRRIVAMCNRSVHAWRGSLLENVLERNLNAAKREHIDAYLMLERINERGVK